MNTGKQTAATHFVLGADLSFPLTHNWHEYKHERSVVMCIYDGVLEGLLRMQNCSVYMMHGCYYYVICLNMSECVVK